MQYNGDANGQDIVTLSNDLVDRDDTIFPIAEKTRYANIANRNILALIFKIYGGWKYDDRNHTNLPIATTDLSAGQTNYSMPNEIISLEGVYVQNQNDDTWVEVLPINLEEIPEAEPEYENTPGVASRYRVVGNTIKFYPPISYSKDDGLMIEFSRDVSTFTVSDTTKTPGFDPAFHEAIAFYMGYRFASKNRLDNKKDLLDEWEKYVGNEEKRTVGLIGKHYARKFRDKFPTRMKQNYQTNDYI